MPESKCKLERWYGTLRNQFLSEIDERCIAGIDDLNARLWAGAAASRRPTRLGGA